MTTGALVDEVEELLRHERLVRRRRAPDPLLARAQGKAAAALVVAAPTL